MKITFKNILIIFLVALLGGAAGTYAVLEIDRKSNPVEEKVAEPEKTVINQIITSKTTNTYSEVIEKSIKTVVEITTEAEVMSTNFFGQTKTSEATYLGSGVIISEDGYIVTNHHVINNAKDVKVALNNGDVYEANIIGYDTKTDLGLLKIEANNLPYSKLIDSDKLVLGQEVIAIGNALGEGMSCSNGIVSAINKSVKIENYEMTLIQTNAELNSGNSGGGLFDMDGNLAGIVNAKTSSSGMMSTASIEGVGYAIPANTVKQITDELLNNGYVKDRATLGLKIYTSSYTDYYNIEGLVVSEVIEGSAADKAGIKAGDIIKAIDDQVVREFSELSKLLESYNIGDKVKLTVERDGTLSEFEVVLQENIQQ